MTIRTSIVFLAATVAILLAVGACGTVPQRNPLPQPGGELATIPGLPEGARFWGDVTSPETLDWLRTSTTAELRDLFPAAANGDIQFLAISGGGQSGAFGAGLLNGWTVSGSRPEFLIVTGVSTGALMAPFAFLGPDYDQPLKDLYTSRTTDDIIEPRGWLRTITGDAAFDTAKLQDLIVRQVDDEMLRRLAEEFARGRMLMIGTTNLDARRPVVWNITQIAASDYPDKRNLIAKVLLASASMPGVFPPVLFEVVRDGQSYDELHVDGGVASQVFLHASDFDMAEMIRKLDADGRHTVFVIYNSRIRAVPGPVKPDFFNVSVMSVLSLTHAQGVGDLFRIYKTTSRDDGDYHLAFIPDDFDREPEELFDRDYMTELYDLGFEMARNGFPWSKKPPGALNKPAR